MTTIELVNEEIDLVLNVELKDSWDEINLSAYLDLVQVITDKSLYEDEEFFLKMLSVLSNVDEKELSDLPVTEFNKVIEVLSKFSSLTIPDLVDDYIDIDGVTYVPKKNLSNLTTSEVIYIKNMQKNSNTTIDAYLSILAIILRPGYLKEEEGKSRYIQYKLDAEDIEDRKRLFKERLTSSVAIPLIKSFMAGMKK